MYRNLNRMPELKQSLSIHGQICCLHLARLLIGLLILSSLINASAYGRETNEAWQYFKNEDGITVYVHNNGAETQPMVKGIMVVDQSIDIVSAVVLNIDNYQNWIADCMESRHLPESPSEKSLAYLAMSSPWPLQNRDILYKLNFSADPATGRFSLRGIAKTDGGMPERNGYIRIVDAEFYTIVERLSRSRTLITFINRIDPGGVVLEGLSHFILGQIVYKSLQNLKKILHSKQLNHKPEKQAGEFGKTYVFGPLSECAADFHEAASTGPRQEKTYRAPR